MEANLLIITEIVKVRFMKCIINEYIVGYHDCKRTCKVSITLIVFGGMDQMS